MVGRTHAVGGGGERLYLALGGGGWAGQDFRGGWRGSGRSERGRYRHASIASVASKSASASVDVQRSQAHRKS